MGSSTGTTCKNCRHHFAVDEGGGFFFHLLRCDRCGRTKSVGFAELGDLHSAYLKGLPGPYAMASWKHDLRVKADYSGAALSEPEYHAAIESSLKRHAAVDDSGSLRRHGVRHAAQRNWSRIPTGR